MSVARLLVAAFFFIVTVALIIISILIICGFACSDGLRRRIDYTVAATGTTDEYKESKSCRFRNVSHLLCSSISDDAKDDSPILGECRFSISMVYRPLESIRDDCYEIWIYALFYKVIFNREGTPFSKVKIVRAGPSLIAMAFYENVCLMSFEPDGVLSEDLFALNHKNI